METDVRTAVEKIGQLDHRSHGEYSAFAIYLNRELADCFLDAHPSKTEPLYGIVIPCGSFKTKDEAEKRTSYISAISGVPVVAIGETGQPFPLSYRPSTQSVIYDRPPDQSITDLQASIESHRKKVEEINMRRCQEQKERMSDPNSIHTYIQQIYLCTRQFQKIEQFQEILNETRKTYIESISHLEDFQRRNPELAKTWTTVAKPRLQERKESEIYHEMVRWLTTHQTPI